MKLVEFSVTNYRSITKAHKIAINDMTVLVGKNNEGKSNLLTALNIAMTAVMLHSRGEERSGKDIIQGRLYTIGKETFRYHCKTGKMDLNQFLHYIFGWKIMNCKSFIVRQKFGVMKISLLQLNLEEIINPK